MTFAPPHKPLVYHEWSLVELAFDPPQQRWRETLFTIGNGYLGTRGTFEEGFPDSSPTTLIHGMFDDVPILYTELANCPDWLSLGIILEGDRFRLDQGHLLFYQRILDLKTGTLRRSVHWRSPKGHTLSLTFERFASLADPHLLAVQLTVQSLDFAGEIEIEASLSGYPDNQGYNHWDIKSQACDADFMGLLVETRGTKLKLALGARLSSWGSEKTCSNIPGYPTVVRRAQIAPGESWTVQKVVSLFTSREAANPWESMTESLATVPDYSQLKQAHDAAWHALWDKSDVRIEGDEQAQLAVRFNLFQLLICGSPTDPTVSIPAKTLSGFGYRGHVFWDTEIFILPFFNFTQPRMVKNLLSYRYHTLEGARRKAQHYGYKGAMFAWESAATGDEVTPRWAASIQPYAEDIRIWCRDLEIHISADVAYAIWTYWQTSGDDDWIRDFGAEIILDTAIFWMSRVELNPKTGFYEIRNVIGADEFHEHVHNNGFTNRIAQWHLEKALLIYHWLWDHYPARATDLCDRLQIHPQVIERWQDIVKKMLFLWDEQTGLIEQFEGFFALEDIDLASYEPRHQSMQSLLGIDGANGRQVLKQPDVLMLLYLMRESRDFPYDLRTLQVNWDYYVPRTDLTYGSSLSPAIHAILACDLCKTEAAYHHFCQAAFVDLEDLRGNAQEGIHGASAGGVWQAVVFGFGGIHLTPSGPQASPYLPQSWTRLQFKLYWRGQWHRYTFTRNAAGDAEGDDVDRVTVDHQIEPSPRSSSPPLHRSGLDLQGAIFDLDGVITDTAEFHYQAWCQLAQEEGLPFDRAMNESLRGVPRRDSLLKILGDRSASEDQLQAMMARKNEYYIRLLQQITPTDLLPGTLALLQEIRQAKVKVALGSASKNARTVLNKLGITHYFDVIADGYSVERSKPAPDLFLFAAQHLGIAPHQTVVFEDAKAGIQAALAAQMWTVGLGPQERVGAAHVVLPSLARATWGQIFRALGQKATPASEVGDSLTARTAQQMIA
ncbi:beta-phosphoglucomutase [Lyngbya confervoides]|uniref:Beta-phosphoglucomutase n=1 Tax=Lyngbya confervoides BDU141951 TaxID=1574623 RepID=A0ABD4T4N8_9CYAN|nr:beta-phosphoglucomutase [Lyngbya confervoides]MCM1983453.1 beta-phosphoglucomutase [Lyngbya confervoides BDU141951]